MTWHGLRWWRMRCEPDRVRALIAVGADVNAVHDRGFTVFMSAAGKMERNVECLRLLIEAGADPCAVSELGWNAFHAAVDASGDACAEKSVARILGMLRDVGVDLECRNNQGHTPLARAIFEGSALEVEVLCELGADVNRLRTRDLLRNRSLPHQGHTADFRSRGGRHRAPQEACRFAQSRGAV